MSEALNGSAPLPADFQQQATLADAGVTALFLRLQGLGIPVEAMASGALFALVRLHLGMMGEPRTERELIRIMVPALQKAATELLQDSAT